MSKLQLYLLLWVCIIGEYLINWSLKLFELPVKLLERMFSGGSNE